MLVRLRRPLLQQRPPPLVEAKTQLQVGLVQQPQALRPPQAHHREQLERSLAAIHC